MLTKVVLIIVVSIAMAAGSVSSADADEQINIRVEVVYASHQSRPTDRSLLELKSQLQSMFKFASYVLITRRGMELSSGRVERMSIPGGKYLVMTLESVKSGRVKLAVKISDRSREILSTMFIISPGQTVLLGGPRYKDGSLIVAIKAGF